MHLLHRILEKESRSIIGLMSGTSCDGLDIAHIEVTGSGTHTTFCFRSGATCPYTGEQRSYLLGLIGRKDVTLRELSQMNFYLSGLWAELIAGFLKERQLTTSDIDLIGSHGQTIWHEPLPSAIVDRPVSSTWQAGDPSVLANRLGIPVVGDFRAADVALGGQGAPLIPYFDWLFFSPFGKNILSLNIGGISNVTFVPANGDVSNVIAFDTGPGNMLIDQAAKRWFGKEYDRDSEIARRGNISEPLLQFLLERDTFIDKKPPKSTGREYYGSDFMNELEQFMIKQKIQKTDIITTLTRYTPLTIFRNYTQFIAPFSRAEVIAVGGGGARNPLIMEHLAGLFSGASVQPVREFGIEEDFKEAIGFAILANETIHALPSNVPQVTGASRPAVLGKICLV